MITQTLRLRTNGVSSALNTALVRVINYFTNLHEHNIFSSRTIQPGIPCGPVPWSAATDSMDSRVFHI